MFIQTEKTPNPKSLKFIPGCEIMLSGIAEFKNIEEASSSPLAQRFFKIEGVGEVFFGKDFITITKSDDFEWEDLQTIIMGAIMEHFTNGEDVILHESEDPICDEDSEIVTQIKELLNERIRPAVAQDGGDIAFESYENGIVYLHLRGACAGCPGAASTLKNSVENLLKHFIPEVQEVRAVN